MQGFLENAGTAECKWYHVCDNQLLFADDEALVVDSEKLCRLVSEFGKLCERRKLGVNVCNSKVVRCSRYGNVGTIACETINSEPLEEVDCFKYLELLVAVDGGCDRSVVHTMNVGRVWGALKSVLNNAGFGINAKSVYMKE